MKLVREITGPSTIITAEIGGRPVDLVLDDSGAEPRYYMGIDPSDEGRKFGFPIHHTGTTMAAYPAFAGDGTGRRHNIYLENDATDANDTPADGGMYEAERADTGYEYLEIKGYPLPDNRHMPWVIANGGAFMGDGANDKGRTLVTEVWIYRRTPVNPKVTIIEPRRTRGSDDSDYEFFQPSIGVGQIQDDERTTTGIPYNRDAVLVAHISLVGSTEFERLMAKAGVAYR